MRILETRLDNVVFRLGFAKHPQGSPPDGDPRPHQRERPPRRHPVVPRAPGDLVAVAPKAKELLVIKSALVSNERVQVPAWLEVDIEKLQGSVLALPSATRSIWTSTNSSSSNFTRNNRDFY